MSCRQAGYCLPGIQPPCSMPDSLAIQKSMPHEVSVKTAAAKQPIASLLRLRPDLRRTRQRRLWVCAGEPAWTRRCAQDLIEAWQPESMLCLGGMASTSPGSVPQRDYRHYLGREYDLVLLDAHAGLDVDALAAMAGTLRGGGLLGLLTPALTDWPAREDAEFTRFAGTAQPPSGRFLRRLIGCFADPAVALLEQDRGWRALPRCGPGTAALPPCPLAGCPRRTRPSRPSWRWPGVRHTSRRWCCPPRAGGASRRRWVWRQPVCRISGFWSQRRGATIARPCCGMRGRRGRRRRVSCRPMSCCDDSRRPTCC
ncbi:DUF1726 domain-containing protein [Thiohalobacter thiocyanaticus]|uniref:DUF1726 domain-containing protein n=1 Tax=Thiohalobacter thiocyanaticus TaxID=585455 RepID=A0A426QKW3_9GAMM|nr:DUF1726 domain-containing protein [Thiohalobacter thiocyanaticus]